MNGSNTAVKGGSSYEGPVSLGVHGLPPISFGQQQTGLWIKQLINGWLNDVKDC
jgi:hypothetical protein